MLFDTHCHLAMDDFEKDLDGVISRAKNNNIEMVTVAASPDEWGKSIEIAGKFNIFVALGFSPHDAKFLNEESTELLKKFLSTKRVSAIGETGIDYHYFISTKEEQIMAFEKQIIMAEEFNLPLIIHSRDSFDDTLALLKEVKVPVVIHCFTYGVKEAEEFLKAGFYISFSGIVTFKNADKIKEAAKIVPEDKMLIETDSPYLAPVPFRGKRCEPLFVKETAKFLAQFLSRNEEDFFQKTLDNSIMFFRLK